MRLPRGTGAVLAMLLPGLALAVWLGLGAVFLLMALDGAARSTLLGALAPVADSHGMVLVLWWVLFPPPPACSHGGSTRPMWRDPGASPMRRGCWRATPQLLRFPPPARRG